MKDIKQIGLVKLSRYINAFRLYLLSNGFFEQTLYSTIPYKVTNTDSFKLKDNVFLRFFPEPEIWITGKLPDKFFWIGSLFRDEKKITKIHNYEFKLLDYYIKNASSKEMVDIFFDLLNVTEEALHLHQLSKLDVVFVSYNDFKKDKFKRTGKYWLVVTNYPKEDSFYDTLSDDKETTSKFEIMFVNSAEVIEVAVGGIVGENLNRKRRITGSDNKFLSKEILESKFFGFGFGIERLIYVYESHGTKRL